MILFIIRSLLFLTLFFPLTILADTIWLKNGDRLTGKISLLNNNKLVVDTDYANTITIAWSKIATIETNSELLVTTNQQAQIKTQSIKPAKNGAIMMIDGEEQKVALQDINKLISPKPIIEDFVWTGKVTVALDHKKAETKISDFDIGLNTKIQHSNLRHTLDAKYNRKTRNSKISTDNYKLDYTLDIFATEKFFWQTNTVYSVDRIEDLYKQYILGTGPGYQFWDDSLGSFSLASLINMTRFEYRNKTNENFASWGIRWDYNRYILGKDVEIFTNGNAYRPFTSRVARYALDSSIGLRYKLTDWASFNIKLNRNIVDADSDKNLNETRYIIGLGINW